MMILETNYKIKDGIVRKDGKLVAHGFLDILSALQAVWVLEGSPKGVRFNLSGDAVYSERSLENYTENKRM